MDYNKKKMYEDMIENNARDIRRRAIQKKGMNMQNIHYSRQIKSSNMIKLNINKNKSKKRLSRYIAIWSILAFGYFYVDNVDISGDMASKIKNTLQFDTIKNNIKEVFSSDIKTMPNNTGDTVIHEDIIKTMEDELNYPQKK